MRGSSAELPTSVIQNFFIDRYVAAYANEVNSFIAAMQSGKTPSPSGYDGLQAQKLAEAATKSAQTGEVVRVG